MSSKSLYYFDNASFQRQRESQVKRTTAAILIAALLGGCANTGAAYRPMIDSGRGNVANYETDLRECQAYAAQVAGAADQAMAGAIIGALLGAAIGAAAGGNRYQRNALSSVGAVEGAAGGAMAGETDQRNVIRRCLAGRGYSVLQ